MKIWQKVRLEVSSELHGLKIGIRVSSTPFPFLI